MSDAELVARHSRAMRNYLEWPEMREKIDHLKRSQLGIKTSADPFENTRVEGLEQLGEVYSRLIWIDSSPASIGTLSGHSLGYAVELLQPFTVETFAVLGTGDIGDIPGKPELRFHSSLTVNMGDPFLLKAGKWAYRVTGLDHHAMSIGWTPKPNCPSTSPSTGTRFSSPASRFPTMSERGTIFSSNWSAP